MHDFRRDSSSETIRITDAWIDQLDRRLGWNDKPRSYRLLCAVLHVLRESLPPDERMAVRLCGTSGDRIPRLASDSFNSREFAERVALFFKPDKIVNEAASIRVVVGLLFEKADEARFGPVLRHLPEGLRFDRPRHTYPPAYA